MSGNSMMGFRLFIIFRIKKLTNYRNTKSNWSNGNTINDRAIININILQMKKRITLLHLLLVFAIPHCGLAQTDDSKKTETVEDQTTEQSLDSITDENFVTASLIVAEPSNVIYSVMGHCALRMECPSEQLDYCFTLESDTELGDFIKFFSGKCMARVVSVPTSDYLQRFEAEGREVKQYTLNLHIKEKQLLWKNLDDEEMTPPHLRFDFLNTNCMMMSIMMIEQSLINEQLDFSYVPDYMKDVNGVRIRHHSEHAPWSQFLYITLFGAKADSRIEIEKSLSPTTIEEVLKQVSINNDNDEKRPIFYGIPAIVVPSKHLYWKSTLTPCIVFGMFLLFVILLTIGEWWFEWKRLPCIIDITLLIIQTLLGVMLLYFSLYSNLFGSRWNWYLIPLCPLPIILYLLFRRHRNYHKVYLFYAVILALFIAATPLSSQLDIDHQLITSVLLIRCISNFFSVKFQREKKKL